MWDGQDFASMSRSAKDVVKYVEDVAKHAEDVAKHAEDGQGHCLHAQDVAKHALGTHSKRERKYILIKVVLTYYYIYKI